VGEGSKGRYWCTKSNESYGHAEAPVIHSNGVQLLIVVHQCKTFAFFCIKIEDCTGYPKSFRYIEARIKLAEFMVRIQSTSSGRVIWMRLLGSGLFDLRKTGITTVQIGRGSWFGEPGHSHGGHRACYYNPTLSLETKKNKLLEIFTKGFWYLATILHIGLVKDLLPALQH